MQGDRTERVVLVVEDDRDCLDAVCELLRFEGYRTVAATSGREALDYLRGPERPELLLDLMMPVMSGWQLLASLRQTAGLAAVPVVLLSADADLKQRARELGVAGYVRKPVDVETLLNVVRRHIGAR